METLTIGSSGPEVVLLQQALLYLGFTVSVDGSFGPATEKLVKRFQRKYKLTADGIVGPFSWATLDSLAPQGMDISHLNGQIDWDALSPHIQFIYCKYSQGGSFLDPMFGQNYASIRAKNLIAGAYHFLTFQTPAADQVSNFLSCGLDFTTPGLLPPALDIEWQVGSDDAETAALNDYVLNNQQACVDTITAWLSGMETATGIMPVIYTAAGFWEQYFAGVEAFGSYPLWAPAYESEPPPLPDGWAKYRIWQYSGSGNVLGVSGPVDQDIFNGGAVALAGMAQLKVT